MMFWRRIPFLLLLLAAPAFATTWGVPGNGSNTCTIAVPSCNTIAQAVTASASGDTINIGAGSFPIASAITLTKTLTIQGQGMASTTVALTAGQGGFSVRTNNIVFQDFSFSNGATAIAFQNASSNNTQVTRVAFNGQTSRGIDISLANTFTVSNVAITDSAFATANIGLRMSSSSQVNGLTFTRTTFTNNPSGIYQANDGGTSRLSNFTIDDCTFTNTTNYAIYLEEVRTGLIKDSTFTGGGTGIGVLKFYATNGVAISDFTVQNNDFSGFKGNALDFEIRNLGLETGMTFTGNTVSKDASVATTAAAVYVRLNPSATNAQATISDNAITVTGVLGAATAIHGVQLAGNGPVSLTDNVFDGAGVGGTSNAPASSGIYVQAKASGLAMPATTSITASCNRIQGFRNGVSVFDSVAGVYGGLPAGATLSLNDDAILNNDDAAIVTDVAGPTIDAEDSYFGCPDGPSDPACDPVVGNVDATPFAVTIPACVECVANGECNDGTFCNGAETCNVGTGACVPSSDPCTGGDVCGNQCNEATDSCLLTAGTPCRASAGACDPAETCDGVSAACPADAKSTGVCRPSAGTCDVAESCDGVSNGCPADGFAPSSTVCRASGGACDLAESCTGSSAACPADAKSTGVCRASAGTCDVAESCDGVSNGCPADGFAPSSTVCRASGGACDPQETCSGSGAACPADAKSTSVCRSAAGTCDVAESCDGVSNNCPADAFAPSSTVCRASTGTCDVAESCTGSSAACPADTGLPDGDGDGVCDANDICPGVSDPSQADTDGDGFGDACDNCALVANADQADLDNDGQGNVCDAQEGTLNPTKARLKFSSGPTDKSSTSIKGDFVVLQPGDVFTASAGLSFTVSDGKPTPTVRTTSFTAAECVTTGGGFKITCRTADRANKATFKTSPKANGIWKFSVKLKRQMLTAPQVGPVKVVLTYGPAIDRVGTIEDCVSSFTTLSCRKRR